MPSAPARAHRAGLRRLLRYGSVSAVSTATSLTILGVLVGIFSVSAIAANVIATAIGTIPSFELNRRWVWSHGTARSFRRQVLPYCVLSFAGLILSTLAVHLAANATSGSTRIVHTVAVECANFGAYGALWLLQFVLCDRILFRASPMAPGPSSDSPPAPADADGECLAAPLSRRT
jgi:putative flippase GtrA